MARGFAEVANCFLNTRKIKCVYGPMVRVLRERRTDGHKVERKWPECQTWGEWGRS